MDGADLSQQIEYTRMIVPASMRSHYWKYFGFPADNSNQILTKQKIVCILCNTAIAYNKNTTNLRTHLVAKHHDILVELNNKKKRERRPSSDGEKGSAPVEKRSKIISIPVSTAKQSMNLTTAEVKVSTVPYIEEELPVAERKVKIINKDNSWNMDPQSPIKLSIIDTLSTASEDLEPHDTVDKIISPSDYQHYTNTLEADTYTFDEIYENPIKSQQSSNFDNLIQEMLVSDLLPSNFVNGPGFMKLVYNLGSSASLNRKDEVEQGISKQYDEQFDKVTEIIRSVTSSVPFSIGFEITSNIENKSYLSIYLNYLSDLDNSLQNVFYKMVELNASVNLDEAFAGIELSKCVAAVLNSDNPILEEFLNSHEIPMLPCFSTVINRCMQAAFNLPSVDLLYNKVSNIFQQNCYLDTAPEVYEEYAWSKYNFLTYFNDSLALKDVKTDVALECKSLCDYLAPLQMTLETLADEPLSLSSLIRPLTSRLLEGHFADNNCESEMIAEVREILTEELSLSLTNEFLLESTFFDPRFQKCIYSENLDLIKRTISTKYKHIVQENEEKDCISEEFGTNSKRKSCLKMFLNRSDSAGSSSSSAKGQDSFNFEITKYGNLTEADLDQCPVMWWKECGFQYKQLKKISSFYWCVPCHVTTLFRKPVTEQVDILNRRFMLRRFYASQLWFLHYNKDFLAGLN